jgi:tetratricopeptide (TPR) repeat protein
MLRNLGFIACEQGDFGRSEVLLAESLTLARELGSKRDIATALTELARVAYYRGEYERAEALVAEGLNLYRGLRSVWGIGFSLRNLGAVAHARGDQARAAGFYKESLRLYSAAGEKPMIACCLEGLASVACAQGQYQPGARRLGVAASLREAIGAPLPPANRTGHERTVGDLRMMLGDDLFWAAWAAGRALPLEQAIAEALDVLGSA